MMSASELVDEMIARSDAFANAERQKAKAAKKAKEAARKAAEEAADEPIVVSFARFRRPIGRRPKRASGQKAVALRSN